MISARYKKLSGMYVGHVYAVAAPYDELNSPLRWMLHGEAGDQKLVVSEDELNDPRKWQPIT